MQKKNIVTKNTPNRSKAKTAKSGIDTITENLIEKASIKLNKKSK